METERVSSWVDTHLIEHLHRLRENQPHAPTLRMVATLVVQEGLEELGEGRRHKTELKAIPGSKRQSFAFRVPSNLRKRLLRVSEQLPEASTPSAALHLILWLGINRINNSREGKGAAA